VDCHTLVALLVPFCLERPQYPYIAQVYGQANPKAYAADVVDLDWLTLADARRLAEVDPVDISEFEKVSEAVNKISLPVIQSALRIDGAILVVELLILVSLLWFWINLSQLRSLGTNPPSTVISLFDQGLVTRLLFCAGLLFGVATPAAVLAWQSYSFQPKAALVGLFIVVAARAIVSQTGWYVGSPKWRGLPVASS
jgi:cytochrome bd-type quinol oxidase subunit 1